MKTLLLGDISPTPETAPYFKEKNISQQDIAAFLHIKQNTYSQYENGKRQLPIEILISLARFYNVSTDFILGLTDNEDPYN